MITKYETKEDVVRAFRIKNPNLGYMDDNTFYNNIVSSHPQYKVDEPSTDTDVFTNEFDSDESDVWDYLPDLIKDGYNRSLTGQAQSIMTNKESVFDLKDYSPNVLEDTAASLIAFLSPLDIAATLSGAKIGVKGAQIAMPTIKRLVIKKLIKNGASTGAAKTAARKAVNRAVSASTTGSAMGLYSGANSALRQQISEGSIDPSKVVLDAGKATVLGGASGLTGAIVTEKGAGVLARVGSEIGTFGTLSPILGEEPRLPTPQDYFHAGSMVMGVKGVNYMWKKGSDSLTPIIKEYAEGKRKGDYSYELFPEGTDKLKKQEALELSRKRSQKRDVEEIYNDKKGNRLQITGRSEDGSKVFTRDLATESNKTYSTKYFDSNFKTESFNVNSQTARNKAEKDIRILEKKLKIEGNDKSLSRLTRSGAVDAEIALKLSKKKVLPSVGASNQAPLSKFKSEHLFKYKKELLRDYDFKLSIKQLEKKGILTSKQTYSLFFDTLLPERVKKLFQPFRPTRNQGSSSFERRVHNGKIYEALKLRRELEGEALTAMKDKGLTLAPSKERINILAKELGLSPKEVGKKYYTYLSDAIEAGSTIADAVSFRTIMNRVFDRARKEGLTPSGRIENYLPRMFKEDLSHKMLGDLYKIAKHEHSMQNPSVRKFSSPNDLFNEMVNAMTNPNKYLEKNPEMAKVLDTIIKNSQGILSNETRIAFKHLTRDESKKLNYSEGQSVPFTYYKAMTLLGRDIYRTEFGKMGQIEQRRKVLLPKDYYERDVQKLLAKYVSGASRRTAEVSKFGMKDDVVQELLKSPTLTTVDKNIMQELQAHISGHINYMDKYNLGKGFKDFADNVLYWETATKIGGGTATALNLTQVLASSGMEAGYTRMIRGAYQWIADKKVRRLVDGSGADLFKPVNELMGYTKSSNWVKSLAETLTNVTQFNRINSINNIVSASIAKVFINDMLNVVKKGGSWKALGVSKVKKLEVRNAINTLDRLGINIKDIKKNGKISDAKMMEAMGSFAVKTQVQKNILEDPLWLNRPSLRLLTQFKTFPIRNANYMRRQIEADLLNYNIFPLLRLGATGIAGAGIALKSKDFMKSFFSGEAQYEPSKFINTDGKDIIEALTAIGAFGYMSDIMIPILEEGGGFESNVANKAKWMVTPAFWSDIENFLGTLSKMESDYSSFEGEALRRAPSRLIKLTGSPLLKQFAKKIETTGLKEGRVKSVRSKKLAEFRNRLIEGKDRGRVLEDIKGWNSYVESLPARYSKYRIKYSDYNMQSLMKSLIRKHKRKV